jgi:two-component system, OmpR family, response regulator VicR
MLEIGTNGTNGKVNMGQNEPKPLTTGEIAQFCHVTHRAVLKWVATGKLKAYRTPGNHSRVQVQDFLNFLQEYNMPVPQEFRKTTGQKKILIVDDDRGIVHAIQRLFMMDNKYIIEVAYDGFEAGTRFSTFKPDVVILDICMPGLDGFQVCKKIREDEHGKGTKILAISGLNESKDVEKILWLGADDYLAKPFSNQDLQEKTAKLLGKL